MTHFIAGAYNSVELRHHNQHYEIDMKDLHASSTRTSAFTLIELLVVILVLGILSSIALPSYYSNILNSKMATANANARILCTCVQGMGILKGYYDTNLLDYREGPGDPGMLNPCTGTYDGYSIVLSGSSVQVSAAAGSNCGSWTPAVYTLGNAFN